jgi:hypothetical protein
MDNEEFRIGQWVVVDHYKDSGAPGLYYKMPAVVVGPIIDILWGEIPYATADFVVSVKGHSIFTSKSRLKHYSDLQYLILTGEKYKWSILEKIKYLLYNIEREIKAKLEAKHVSA